MRPDALVRARRKDKKARTLDWDSSYSDGLTEHLEPPRRIELLTYSLRVNRSTD